jgi:NADPH:quinone reductase-like Zn-dependent oxidoreductase
VSGEVVSVGPDQVRFKPGDRVVGHAMAWQKGENKVRGLPRLLDHG